jgi:hypothetical protein
MKIECSGTALIDAVAALGPELDYTQMGSLRREKMCQPANNIDTRAVTRPSTAEIPARTVPAASKLSTLIQWTLLLETLFCQE